MYMSELEPFKTDHLNDLVERLESLIRHQYLAFDRFEFDVSLFPKECNQINLVKAFRKLTSKGKLSECIRYHDENLNVIWFVSHLKSPDLDVDFLPKKTLCPERDKITSFSFTWEISIVWRDELNESSLKRPKYETFHIDNIAVFAEFMT